MSAAASRNQGPRIAEFMTPEPWTVSAELSVADAQERKTRIDRLRAVGALAAGLSHEFATPLNTAQIRLARLARAHDLGEDADLQTAIEELHTQFGIDLRQHLGTRPGAAGDEMQRQGRVNPESV